MDIEYLKESIKQNEMFQKKDKKTTYLSDTLLQVVESFMKRKKRICYGGTAINSILPKEKQFYNYDVDIPDYDFFSPCALDDAKELCNLFKKENVFHVEGKNAVSFGTYKVFVNFVPIADITQIHQTFYDYLVKYGVDVNGILYTPPSYLRMSLHQELARPKGDISRWEKIYQRMQLLNTYFPILTKPLSERQHHYIKIRSKHFENKYDVLYDFFRKNKYIFCNLHLVSCLYKKHFKYKKCDKNERDFFLVYVDDLKTTVSSLKDLNLDEISIKNQESNYKFIGDYAFLYYKERRIGILFQTNSCLSYIETKNKNKKIRVGNIDTLLNLYFSIILMEIEGINYNVALSVIGELNNIVDKYEEYINKGIKENDILTRFKLPCLGDQEDLPKILRTRQRKFRELKHNKSSIDYKKWFFRYTPTLDIDKEENKSKTSKNKKTKDKRRTKKKVEKKT